MKRSYDPATGEMCFSNALEALKQGKTIKRKGWNQSVSINIHTLRLLPFCNLRSEDILATDWVEDYEIPAATL